MTISSWYLSYQYLHRIKRWYPWELHTGLGSSNFPQWSVQDSNPCRQIENRTTEVNAFLSSQLYPLPLVLFPSALILYMFFTVEAINVVQHPHLSCKDPLVCQSVARSRFHTSLMAYYRLIRRDSEFGGMFLVTKHICKLVHLFHALSILFATFFHILPLGPL